MSKDIIKIDKEEFNQEKAIDLDGEIFDLPVRTKDLHEKIVELESKRQKMKEFDFYNEIFAVIFGKANAKKIVKDNSNLDYLSKIYRVSTELIYADKLEAEREEMEKQINSVSPMLDKLSEAKPYIERVK